MTARSGTGPSASRLNLFTLLAGLLVALLVLALRLSGLFQPLELAAYDTMVRMKPSEPPDRRVLVVRIDEESVNKYGSVLPDALLQRLLAKLLAHGPRVVGIDIYRNRPEGALAELLKNDTRIFGVFRVNKENTNLEIPPPPSMGVRRAGFSDMPKDDDRVVRHAFLYGTLKSGTQIYALAYQLALRYLDEEQISQQLTPSGELQLGVGGVVLNRLGPDSGGYQNQKDFESSYQSLINFRLPEPARGVTMSDVLDGRIDPAWIKDRVLLVGYTAESKSDDFDVPYGVGQTPGVILHAHLLSQFLAAALDSRPFFWSWSEPVEGLWVLFWGTIAALISWRVRPPALAVGAVALALIVMVGASFWLFTRQGWVPIAAPAAALALGAVAVLGLNRAFPALPGSAAPSPLKLEVEGDSEPAPGISGGAARQETIIAEPTGRESGDNLYTRPTGWIGKSVGSGGRYRIDGRIGSGGMGEVFLALDRSIGREVALKILSSANIRTDTQVRSLEKRFEKEVRVCAALRSGNIVQVSDYGLTPEGYPFYVMEYLQGQSLGQLLRKEGRLDPKRVVAIARQVCLGLRHAHGGIQLIDSSGVKETVRVIHRDLKPDNIFLVPTDLGEQVKVLDFGIAKTISEADPEEQADLTMGGFLGTSRYAAPEQWRGERSLDLRADLYSLGIILYEALSGTNPFGIAAEQASTTLATWYEGHVLREPIPLRSQPGCAQLPEPIERIVMRCLVKSPDGRFDNVGELLQALDAVYPG